MAWYKAGCMCFDSFFYIFRLLVLIYLVALVDVKYYQINDMEQRTV